MAEIESRHIYIPRYFDVREFVPPEVYKALGASSWQVMDPRMIWTLDQIRAFYKRPITVNNWHTGGPFKYRGFRPRSYTETTAAYGDHYMGRATDFDVAGMSAEEFRKQIRMNLGNPMFRYVTICEEGVNWVHLGIRPVPQGTNGILFIKG
jgi:hypothetical protein